MSNSLISYHDALFKTFLGDISVARDFLEIHLPPHLRERCDFSTLALESGSFIEDDLRTQCSDMLYSVQTNARIGYVYCLIEHQSRPEKLMAFRLMRYAIAAMQRHLEQGNDSLPVVIPLLFYHGSTLPYPYSTHRAVNFFLLREKLLSKNPAHGNSVFKKNLEKQPFKQNGCIVI